uniref:Uncharacterized protein n=1 Tax=Rhizophora mucronata TaxID=61149 RepID=A0A2P2Q749_RHIMU
MQHMNSNFCLDFHFGVFYNQKCGSSKFWFIVLTKALLFYLDWFEQQPKV